VTALAPHYRQLIGAMRIDASHLSTIDKIAARLLRAGMGRYAEVAHATGVPIAVIAALHSRESDGCFGCWLHNGDPMFHQGVPIQTVNVPAHRPPNPNISWELGAIDALVFEGFDKVGAKNWSLERAAYEFEEFNGPGYRQRSLPSPYLWAWSSCYRSGKFVADRTFSTYAVDKQLGCMPLISRIAVLDPALALPLGAVA
jgi:lysozyme family protein